MKSNPSPAGRPHAITRIRLAAEILFCISYAVFVPWIALMLFPFELPTWIIGILGGLVATLLTFHSLLARRAYGVLVLAFLAFLFVTQTVDMTLTTPLAALLGILVGATSGGALGKALGIGRMLATGSGTYHAEGPRETLGRTLLYLIGTAVCAAMLLGLHLSKAVVLSLLAVPTMFLLFARGPDVRNSQKRSTAP
jgi:hypothetical protein